jgi:hypothetical protein
MEKTEMTDQKQIDQTSANLSNYVIAANRGDKSALAKLRTELAGNRAIELIESIGNLANQVEYCSLKKLGDQEGAKAVIREKLGRMRIELGWPTSNAMERLLIERIVQNWLQLHLIEMLNGQADGRTPKQLVYDEERVVRAERRYLNAIKALATIRKLALPQQIDVNLRT